MSRLRRITATAISGLTGTAMVAGVGGTALADDLRPTPQVTVSAPSAASGPVTTYATISGSMRLSLEGARNVAGSQAAGSSTVVYPNATRDTDLAVQTTNDGGARVLVTLKNRQAPTEQRYRLTLPAGTRLSPDGKGGYDFLQQTGQALVGVGHIDAPWAKDADGRSVATSYTLAGDTLVQHVAPARNTAFPVVADPHYTWGIVTGTAYFNKHETYVIATRADWVDVIVPVLPFPFAGLVEAYKTLVKTNAQHARQMNMCVKIRSDAAVGIYGGNEGDGYCR